MKTFIANNNYGSTWGGELNGNVQRFISRQFSLGASTIIITENGISRTFTRKNIDDNVDIKSKDMVAANVATKIDSDGLGKMIFTLIARIICGISIIGMTYYVYNANELQFTKSRNEIQIFNIDTGLNTSQGFTALCIVASLGMLLILFSIVVFVLKRFRLTSR